MNNGKTTNGAVAKKTTTTNGSAAAVSSFSVISEALETKTKEQLTAEITELKEVLKFAERSVTQMQSLVDFFERQNKELREENARLRKQVHGQYEPIAEPRDLQPMVRHPLAVSTNSETLVDDEDFDEQLKLAMRLSLEENRAALPSTSSSSSSSSSTTTTSLRPAAAIDPEDSPGLQH